MSLVPVYEHDDCGDGRGAIVGRVKYNSNLDHWDGNNWSDGGVGTHLGITRLSKSGRMVRIHGTQWQGSKDRAYVMTDAEAIQLILDNDPDELENWPHLKALAEAKIETEA
jgi:hypothetical protein